MEIFIDGKLLKEMVISGGNNLEKHKALIDKLNVFPVPDGDTGTNMSLTMASAMEEVMNIKVDSITEVGKAATKGSLMGARGNSGVILSQLLRGFSKSIEGKEKLSVEDFATALKGASDMAYKAVIKPIEGTILTVARETAEFGVKEAKNEKNMKAFLEALVQEANRSLNRTPELLISLKEANVVDSGGKGFVCILEGMYKAFIGEKIEAKTDDIEVEDRLFEEEDIHIYEGELEFGYCTEFMLHTDEISPENFKTEIEGYGDSLIVVGDDEIIKIHIHTNNPGAVMELAVKYGGLNKIKIENMRLQHEKRVEANKDSKADSKQMEQKEVGLIAVAMGDGISKILKDFGVDVVIEGGQTMNPSTQDFLEAIAKINAKEIYIFPNNSNIIMAANQAADISEKSVSVILSKSIPQGFAALMQLNRELDRATNLQAMSEALNNVKTGQVTFAVRDTQAGDISIKEGDIIGIGEKEIKFAGQDINEIALKLVEDLTDEDSEIISLFYGDEVSEEDANQLVEAIEELKADCDVELYQGGQPLYYYIISVE